MQLQIEVVHSSYISKSKSQRMQLKCKKSAPLLFATAFSVLFGIINNYHSVATLGWIRRFLPLAIPGCYISILFLLASARRWGQFALIIILSFNLVSTLSSFVAIRENPSSIKEYQEIRDSLGDFPTTISFDGLLASVLVVPLHSQFDVPAIYLSKGLNPRKLTVIQLLLSSGRNLYIIYTGSGAEDQFSSLSRELSRYGFTLEKHLSKPISVKAYDYFCQEWRPGRELSSLFLPPGLHGLCPKIITYPVSIWKISYRSSSMNLDAKEVPL